MSAKASTAPRSAISTGSPARSRRPGHRRDHRAAHPVHQDLHRLLGRAVREPAGAFPGSPDTRANAGGTGSPHRACRGLHHPYRRRHPLRRRPRLLRDRHRPDQHAAVCRPSPPRTISTAPLLHELVHYTRHESRLNRDCGRKRWGDAGYAIEELVAELGSAFLVRGLGHRTHRSPGSCQLHRILAGSAEERQAGNLPGRGHGRACRRLAPRLPARCRRPRRRSARGRRAGAAHRRHPSLPPPNPTRHTRRAVTPYHPDRIDGAAEWAKLSPDVQSVIGAPPSS